MKSSFNAKVVLVRALAKIQKGWTKGRLYRREKGGMSYCAVGAMQMSIRHDSQIQGTAFYEALRIFIKANRIPEGYITDWNDAPRRTKEQIIAAFKKAITRA